MPADSGAGTHIFGTTCGAQNGLRVYPDQWLKKRVRGARQNMDKAAKKGGEAPQQECQRDQDGMEPSAGRDSCAKDSQPNKELC